ncbi:hypothetical protein DSO57_1012296 [Entomophthora muscae]|uniref:Uncharacterized protein n=1 Tax=Entomophthora muscae TaxID=34485 RepID=A0ACC2SJ28_9FUNG|nr:hypothetical protein DSO57_1012296 [Entomophthora muscae]
MLNLNSCYTFHDLYYQNCNLVTFGEHLVKSLSLDNLFSDLIGGCMDTLLAVIPANGFEAEKELPSPVMASDQKASPFD